jgi:hypothetical protein
MISLPSCFWARGKTEYHGGSTWWNKTIHFMARRKEEKVRVPLSTLRAQRPKVHLLGSPS